MEQPPGVAASRSVRAWSDPRVLALLGVALPAAVGVALWVALARTPVNFGVDLRIYHDALVRAWSGHSAYGQHYSRYELPFAYPPPALVLIVPFVLPVGLVLPGLFVVTVTAWMWCVRAVLTPGRVLARWSLVLDARAGVVAGLLLVSTPVLITLRFGQINVLVAALVLLDLLALAGSRWAGVPIAVAVCLKVAPALFVVWLVVLGFRAAAVRAVLTGVGLLVVALVLLPSSTLGYLDGGLGGSVAQQNGRAAINQSLYGWLLRVSAQYSSSADVVAAVVLGVALAGAGLWLATRLWGQGLRAVGVTVVGVTACFVEPLGWYHHLVWLPLLAVALWVERGALRGARLAVGALLVVSFLPDQVFIGLAKRSAGPVVAGTVGALPLLVSCAVGVWLWWAVRQTSSAAPTGGGHGEPGEDRASGLLDGSGVERVEG